MSVDSGPMRERLEKAVLVIQRQQARIAELETMRTEPIALIGMGCRFPGDADSPESFWRLLHEGVDAVADIPAERWDVDAYYDPNPETPGKMYTRRGAFLKDVDQFDPAFFGISPREAPHLDPQQRLLLEVSWEALEHAGIPPHTLRGGNTGVFVGSMTNDYAAHSLVVGAASDIGPYTGTGAAGSFLPGRLSYQLGLQGPSIPIDAACASSLVAVHLACAGLRNRECDLALAGGVNVILSPRMSVLICKLRALSPDGRCKAFDASADGFGRGEGCGMLVLRRLSDALSGGDNILAVIRGSAINHNGPSSGITVPNPLAQQEVIRNALASAGVAPHEVGLVEAHGTGTILGDPAELRALWAVLGKNRSTEQELVVGSVKTNIAHTEGAAGVAGLIKVVLSLQHELIPPHLHLQQLNPHIVEERLPIRIPRQPMPWPMGPQPRRAGVSSFGLSGINAHVVLEEAPPLSLVSKAEIPERSTHVLCLSARNRQALRDLGQRYFDWLTQHPKVDLAGVCSSAGMGRTHFEHRAAVCGKSIEEMCSQLLLLAKGEPAREPDDPFAAQYVRGEAVDFAGRYGPSRKLALPTYPFQRQRYWHDENEVEQASTVEVHPLLGQRQRSPLCDVLYVGRLGCDVHPFLADHRVFSTIVVSGALLATLPLCAAAMPCTLGNFVVQEPLILDEHLGREIHVVIQQADAQRDRAVEIYSLADDDRAWQLHARGSIQSAVETTVNNLQSLDVLRARLEPEPVEKFYALLAEHGLQLGASHRVIRKLWIGSDEALGELVLAEAQSKDARALPIHPVLLDACVQVLGGVCGTQAESKDPYVVFAIEKLTLFVPLPARIFCHVRARSASIEAIVAELHLRDESGLLLGRLDGVTVRRAPRQVLLRALSRSSNRQARGSDSLREPADIASQLSRDSVRWEAEIPLASIPRIMEQVEALALEYVRDALCRLGWRPSIGTSTTPAELADSLGIVPRYRRLARRLLEILAEASCLVRENDRWLVRQPLDAGTPEQSQARLLSEYPQARVELALLGRCGTQLSRVLRGEVEPLGLIFSADGSLGANDLYHASPGLQLLNRLVGEAIALACRDLPAGMPLRVLEIGAGTGGTTRHVVPILPTERTEYVYSDISPMFFAAAREQFAAHPFVEYQTLDIERDPYSQEFPAHHFDLVIAANVLHATKDLPESVTHALRLLAPRGLLVLFEGIQRQRWLDLTFGLLDGWWRFDDDIRRHYPLLNLEEWSTLLVSLGCDPPAALAPKEVRSSGAVILTRGPATVVMPESAPAARPRSAPPLPSRPVDPKRSARLRQELAEAGTEGRGQRVLDYLQEEVGRVLALPPGDKPDPRRELFTLGFDSLMAVEMRNRIQTDLPLVRPLDAAVIFQRPVLADLTEHLLGLMQHAGTGERSNGAQRDWSVETALPADIHGSQVAVESRNAARMILLTGATGFLGAFLLHELLEQTQAKIYCLVRCPDAARGVERLRRNLQTYRLWDDRQAARIVPVPGRLDASDLGLSAAEHEALAQSVDAIYHNGAAVNFLYGYDSLRTSNVLGTLEVLRLASRGKRKAVHHISTLYALHIYRGWLRETAVPSDLDTLGTFEDVDFAVGYAQSKAVAELLVREAGKRGLPVTIYRPGFIAGSSASGAWSIKDFPARLIKAWVELGAMTSAHLNLTPADYVSKAIVCLSRQADVVGQTFHVTTPRSLSGEQFAAMFQALGLPMRMLPYEDWCAGLAERSRATANVDLAGLLELMPARQPPALNHAMQIDCRQIWEKLSGSDIVCPDIDVQVLEKYLTYFAGIGFLERTGLQARQS